MSSGATQGLIVSCPPNPTDHILRSDLDPEFVETVATQLAWQYDQLFRAVDANPFHDAEQKLEEYQRRRGDCAVNALTFGCERHRVPFDRQRLPCNGQTKLLVRMGRVIIMQEAIDAYGEPPKVAEYKQQLASINSIFQQLEFDFGDGRFRGRDWSGCVLAVLLHKPVGPTFSESHKTLGGVSLAVPDAGYSHWTRRFDLHEIAMFGRRGAAWPEPETEVEAVEQADKVNVSIKKKNVIRDTER